jgi:hypothetical protein
MWLSINEAGVKTLGIYDAGAVWFGSDIKDFVGLLTTLEPRTYWRISPVPGDRDDYFDATGASSEKLEMLAKSGEFITGEALAELAQETRQRCSPGSGRTGPPSGRRGRGS